jgi:starvation-inducible DNA-binding protein
MNTIANVLNQQVANWTVLHMKLHHFHWNVKGPHFFTLHAKFEELYTESAARIDLLAERMLAIGGKPVSTLADIIRLASIKEATVEQLAEQMTASIADDFKQLVGELKQGIKIADSYGDEVTEDLLIAIQTDLEKQIWMLNAFNAQQLVAVAK